MLESIKNLSKEDLLKAHNEISDLRDTGILTDGIVRKIRLNEKMVGGIDFGIDYIISILIDEMARRWVNSNT